jgi:hypothetical protein
MVQYYIGTLRNFSHYFLQLSVVRPVRLAYQSPAISNQSVLFFKNKSAPAISHQPNEHAGGPKG